VPRLPSLIEIQLDVLFTRNAHGRLIATRDASPRPAPRVFLGRSAERNVWAVHEHVDERTRSKLEQLLSAEPRCVAANVGQEPLCRAHVLELLRPVAIEYRGPAYVLGDDLPRDDRAREITAGESSAWLDAFPWLREEFEAVAPVAIAFEAGEPAAICHSPRGLTTAAAEAGVETIERFRGRGLAAAAVACWARAVQRSGRLALYSTSWDNAASQAIARRLSARLYGEDWHVA
jgi:RimJ/RimL family protein N-acetyltransferase